MITYNDSSASLHHINTILMESYDWHVRLLVSNHQWEELALVRQSTIFLLPKHKQAAWTIYNVISDKIEK